MLSATGIAAILFLVLRNDRQPLALDLQGQRFFHDAHTSVGTQGAKVLHVAGDAYSVIALVFLIAAICYVRGRKSLSMRILVTFLFLGIALEGIKWGVGRERPDPERRLVQEIGKSFPSGHATGAMTLALLGIEYARKRWAAQSVQATAWTLCLGWTVVMGISRVYLGVHYLSDVGAGWLLGILSYAVGNLVVRMPKVTAKRA